MFLSVTEGSWVETRSKAFLGASQWGEHVPGGAVLLQNCDICSPFGHTQAHTHTPASSTAHMLRECSWALSFPTHSTTHSQAGLSLLPAAGRGSACDTQLPCDLLRSQEKAWARLCLCLCLCLREHTCVPGKGGGGTEQELASTVPPPKIIQPSQLEPRFIL